MTVDPNQPNPPFDQEKDSLDPVEPRDEEGTTKPDTPEGEPEPE